jgi:hypothetical protein
MTRTPTRTGSSCRYTGYWYSKLWHHQLRRRIEEGKPRGPPALSSQASFKLAKVDPPPSLSAAAATAAGAGAGVPLSPSETWWGLWGTTPTRAQATALAQEGSSTDQLKCCSSLILTKQHPSPPFLPPMEQTRPRGFAHRSPPLPLRHLPSERHLGTRLPVARPLNSRNSAARHRPCPTAASSTPMSSGNAGASVVVPGRLVSPLSSWRWQRLHRGGLGGRECVVLMMMWTGP